MRETKPAYNLINNNCQNFAVSLLDAIHVGAHRQFATAFAVYQAATGKGAVKDLFADKPPEEVADDKPPEAEHEAAVQHAQQVMDENTTKLDNHRSIF